MSVPTRRSIWMPYLLIAILGYVIGSVSPSQLLSRSAKMVEHYSRRSLEEEGEEEEEEEGGFDLSSVSGDDC